MHRYRISIVLGLALLYVLVLSAYQNVSAESGNGSDQASRHRDASETSSQVSIRVIPAPDTSADPILDPDRDDEYYRSGPDSDWNGGDYGTGSLPFTGPGHSVIFALESGLTAILTGTLLVLLSKRADRSRRISRATGH